MAKDYLRTFLAWMGIPTCASFSGYDLLLPNSEDEIRNVKRYCRLKRGVAVAAVPNAIDPLPDFVEGLERPSDVPKDDYVLVPGVFAERKNQLMFIRAMKSSGLPVVFMGDGLLFERCRQEAGLQMTFLGHIAHGTSKFYAVMKYALVACLPSNCETPGIAGLEAAALGARPVVPYEGGTSQYYGWDAEYLDPLSAASIRDAVDRAWRRGRLGSVESARYAEMTWKVCAMKTEREYCNILNRGG